MFIDIFDSVNAEDLASSAVPAVEETVHQLGFLEKLPALGLLFYFALNFVVTGIIIRYFYFRKTQRRDYLFTFLVVSTTIFLMVFLLESVKIKIGFALGLFAIFGILRYRTDTLPVREMTYLFAIIGISVINALSNDTNSFYEILITNVIFLTLIWILETNHIVKHTCTKSITYDKINLIKPALYNEMLADLRERTGLDITRFDIGSVDLKKAVASVKVYYPGNGESIAPAAILEDMN
jgi:hypothetical protein